MADIKGRDDGNNFTYLSHADNKGAASATTVTASSTATGYAANNVKTLPVAKHWRSTGKTSENLQIDLGSAQSVNLMGVVNHNLTSSGTITVNGGSSANPDGSQYTTTLTYRQFDAFKLLATAQSWRYWKFIFADSTNADGFIKVGYIMLGNATTLGTHWQYGSEFSDRYFNLRRRSAGGAPYVEAVYNYVSIHFRFGPFSQSEMSTFRIFFRGQSGGATPFFCIPESGVYDGWFGRFTDELVRRLDYREYCDITFDEDPRGRTVVA